MSEQAYTEHRYGWANGQTKVKPARTKGAEKYRSTDSAMSDKMRYNVTRFSGEQNAVHSADESGDTASTTDYRAAYQGVQQGAAKIAAESRTGRAAIYDTTLSPGGRLTDDQAHQLAAIYKADLERRGYRVEGMTYAIHQGTKNTHLHMMYATQKTIQKADNAGNKREMATQADKLRTAEQRREWAAEQARSAAQRAATRTQTRTTEQAAHRAVLDSMDNDRGR